MSWAFKAPLGGQRQKVYMVERYCNRNLPQSANARNVTQFVCMNPFFTVENGNDAIPVNDQVKSTFKEAPCVAVTSHLQTQLEHTIRRWPRKTDVWCLHDCHPFTGVPFPLPESYDEKKGRWTISGEGVCCGAECVKAHYEEQLDYHTPHKLMVLDHFARDQFGIKEPIKSAPPRSRLRVFNNDPIHGMDIDEFRQYHTKVLHVTKLPLCMVVHAMVFAEEMDGQMAVGHVPGVVTPSLQQGNSKTSMGQSQDDMAPLGSQSLPSMFNAFLLDKAKVQGDTPETMIGKMAMPSTGTKKNKQVVKKRKVDELMKRVASETPNVMTLSNKAGQATIRQLSPTLNIPIPTQPSAKKPNFTSNQDSLLSMLTLPTFNAAAATATKQA